MAAELPKDAEGREIPLDTEILYDNDGRAGIECTDCGRQVDSHAGHIDNGRVFACEKGKPPMREAGYHCRHCEPKGVGHD